MRWGKYGFGLATVLATALTAACSILGTDPPAPGSPPRAELERLLGVVRLLDTRPPLRGYERGCQAAQACVFGPAWSDDHDGPGGHDGCDARNTVLANQLHEVHYRPNTHDCVVQSGTLNDPYTGRRIPFTRTNPRTIQIDHVYPLAAAWAMGAATWPLPHRLRFANDITFNLLAVDGETNESKGARTPSDWLPPSPAYHCFYAGKFLTVAIHYDLPITKADHRALTKVASRCP
ncbi:HNH endonuclease family protein [Nocardia sp. NPDC004068]|uniref:HNH endonuclease family protein n=1 Tax=Nocardia sp. NPDC004068 TaxID=3364303 RepID=UPI0036D0B940